MRTELPPDGLPTKDGQVDMRALARVLGWPDLLPPGAEEVVTGGNQVLILRQGRYVVFSDSPGDYQGGVRASLVIPMHIDTPQQALAFVQNTGGRYAVRQVPERSLILSRQLLPAVTTIVLFGSS